MKEILRLIRKIFTKINPVLSNEIMCKSLTHKKLNLKNPKTFNDKINWLKIYDYPNNYDVINCTDKFKIHNFLNEKGLNKYNVKLINSWESASMIDWNSLPEQFVLKCNHGSKYNIICKSKENLDKERTIKKLNKWMKEDYGLVCGELHYSKIKRRIICEEYLGDNIKDFQVWCTYGKILFVVYINNPHGENTKITYDENWNKLDFVTSLPRIESEIEKPRNFEKIIEISKKLSENFAFLRMDFYLVGNDKFYISEMTFSPASGFVQWSPAEMDYKIGDLIDIKSKKKVNIGIIGRVAKEKDLFDGQTVLTRLFSSELKNRVENSEMYFVDTYNYKKNAIQCFGKTMYVLKKCDYIFILLSRNGLKVYLPLLYYFNKIFHKKIFHRVIGGNLDDLVKKNTTWKKYLNSFEYNYVETQGMKNKLEKLGINNVIVSANFKPINPISNIELLNIINEKKNEKRFCIFSRVTKEKGITDAIMAINIVSKELNKPIYLDIYGPIDSCYKEELDRLLANNKNVTYKGVVNYNDSVNVLKNYYMLLFPTYWISEGFPGTVIDCLAAGLPIIATDWNYNSEIIKNNVTGLIYKRDSENKNLVKALEYSINNEEKILDMKKNCMKEFEKYTTDKIFKDIIMNLKLENKND